MIENFPLKLKELRERAGFESQTKFAEACGVDNSTIARLERGQTRPNPKTLVKLVPILRVTLNELMIAAGYMEPTTVDIPQAQDGTAHLTKEGHNAFITAQLPRHAPLDSDLTNHFKDDDFVRVPILKTIKTGYDSLADQEIIGYELISTTRVSDGEYFYLIVTGDSMIDSGIKEGYRVLVKHQNFVEQGKIAVVIINGDVGTLKRVYYEDSKAILQSENAAKKYPPLIMNTENVQIQGQVSKVEFDV